jgi:GAF domain-containing protein
MIGSGSYVLIVDTDPDRISAAVRGCGEALPVTTLIARSGDDATRILKQLGAPAVLIVTLTLPGRDGLIVIEALRHIDDDAPVIVFAEDRGLREYAMSRLAGGRAKLLGGALSAELCRRCIGALARRDQLPSTATVVRVDDDENWFDLAERARQRLGVAGAAAYTRVIGATEYRVSASWRPDAPLLSFPAMLSSAIEDVMTNRAARMWADLADDSAPSSPSAVCDVALRSLAIVPIVRDGGVAGALCAFDPEPRAFRRHDLETLAAFAGRATTRIPGPPSPIDRGMADTIVQSELARGDQLPASVILFAVTAREATDVPAVDEMLAAAVRGNDLVVRWTRSEMLVVLTGVDDGTAHRVAERIRGAVETTSANQVAISGAVANLRATDSLGDVVARATSRPASRGFR